MLGGLAADEGTPASTQALAIPSTMAAIRSGTTDPVAM
jgi:hypothetical protein